jgi:chromosome segregation ATPase
MLSRFDHEEEPPAEQDLDARVTRLVTQCEALAAVARQHERLTGDHEVLAMAVEELQMRLQLSKDQENEELDNTKQLLEHVKQELTEALEGAQLKDDEWQKEKESWLLDRKQMEATIADLQSQLEAMSGLGHSKDVEQSLHEACVARENDALKEDLAQAKLAAEEVQRAHVEKLAEVEANSKREIDELSSRLQHALQSLAAEQSSTRIEELEQELARAQADVREADSNQEAEANRADDAVRELERLKQEMEELVQQHARALEETSSQRAAEDNESEVQRLSELVAEKDRQSKQAEASAAEARSYRDFLQAEMDELSGQMSALETAKTHFANENAQLRQKLSELNHEMLQVPETLAGELDQLTERIESLRSELDTKAAHEKILTTLRSRSSCFARMSKSLS